MNGPFAAISALVAGVAPALAVGAGCAGLTTAVAAGGVAFGSSAGFFLLADLPGCSEGAMESASPSCHRRKMTARRASRLFRYAHGYQPPVSYGSVYFVNIGHTTLAFAASCPPLLSVHSVT